MKKLLFTIFFCLLAVSVFAGETVTPGNDMPHRMMMLMLQLGVILFAARLGNILFEKLHVSGVLGELVAGIVIGPYLLGALPVPGFENGLFPLYSGFALSPELYGICTLASVVLLFVVGLETDIRLFMRYSLDAGLVGIGGVLLSFVLGDLVSMICLPALLGVPVNFFSPPCLFLGIIATATSVGITARVLSEEGKLDSPEGVTILGGAVIDDVLGIVLLAVGMGVISASQSSGNIDWNHIIVIGLKAVGIWLAATVIGLVASQKIGTLLKWFRDRSSIAIMALGLALILAGLFEEAGLAMIIGAYVTGLSLSRTDINRVIREKMKPVYALLVPVFFAAMGMMVDLRMLLSKEVVFFGIVYTLVVSFAKVAGCGLPALFSHFNLRGALRIGVGMLPRGEVTLIMAGIGLAAGALTPPLFGVVVLMVLLATLATPPALVRLFRNPASGLRKAEAADPWETQSFQFPSSETADLLVSKLLAVFEAEGFFIHLLNRTPRIYQLRKDSTIIGFQHQGTDIIFTCAKAEIAFVNTAMYEVLAELERTIDELRKPVDTQAIGRRLQEQISGPSQRRSLASYVSIDVLEPALKGENKKEIIETLLEILRKKGAVKDLDGARKAVWAREESMSTGMQYGTAMPHGRTDAVQQLVCAIGLKREGVDFDSIDGKPSTIFVMTLSPKSASAPHVRFMSTVSQILNEEGREALLSCETSKEMYAFLVGQKTAGAIIAVHQKRKEKHLAKVAKKTKAHISKYLHRDLMALDLTARTSTGVIKELLNLLDRKKMVRDPLRAYSEVIEREKRMASGLEHGVAIPHARTDVVEDLVCAVGISRCGVDFGAMDGQPCSIIVLTLSPKDVSVPHGHFMAMISRALHDEGRQALLSAKTPKDMVEVLTRGEG